MIVTATLTNSTGTALDYMSFTGGGITANDAQALIAQSSAAGVAVQYSATFYVSGLTVGSQTLVGKYRVSAGTGTYTNRSVTVIPLP